VGYVAAAIKDVRDIRVGDTITDAKRPTDKPVEGFRPAKPMVYAGLYPTGNTTFEDMRDALERYSINDAALTYEVESSPALGMGFRCGFLGLLHLEIVQERLEREYDIELITTAPNVIYKVITTKREEVEVRNPSQLPNPNEIDKILEPYIEASIITPNEYVGSIMQLVQEKRGIQKGFEYIDQKTVLLRYEIPLGEVLFDFHDKLKTVSRGYASFDYEFIGYREGDLVKMDILINGEVVDTLSFIVHRDKAYRVGRNLVDKMKEVIPRQLFEVKIQAAIGSKIIASNRVAPLRGIL
jgi:GTP-binding protein LepA